MLTSVDADGVHRLRGLVDGDRYLYRDALMDLVSPAIYRRIEDARPPNSCAATGTHGAHR